METERINQENPEKDTSSQGKKKTTFVGGAATGAAGAAGIMAAKELLDDSSPVIIEPEPQVPDPIDPIPPTPVEPEQDVVHEEEIPVEPSPISGYTPDMSEPQPQPSTPVEAQERIDINEYVAELDIEPLIGLPNPDIDINEIADNIISGEYIDPNDIETNDINFTDIGVYTINGNNMIAAEFTHESGGDLYMVDLDNDGTFDLIADADGYIIQPIDGLVVSDAENMMMEEPGYLAQNEFDDNSSMGEDFLQDIIDA